MEEIYERTPIRMIDAFTAAALGDLQTLRDVVSPQNVNMKNADGWTMLMYACYYDRLDIVKFLLRFGVDKSLRCRRGRTALMIAATSGNLEIIPLVLEIEVLEFKEDRGMTALSLSIDHGHLCAAQILLSSGANPDVMSQSGTPLMTTAERGHYSAAKALLSYKANPLLLNSERKTAADLASEKGHHDLYKLITSYVKTDKRDVQRILIDLSLEEYLSLFKEKNITYQRLLDMTEEEMKSIGINKFGPRRKLSIFINQMKNK
ncbi:ankyrin repeat and SAM domain-containing protein 3 [Halyomorpha halys]|uniref:ankyrin repeat and SAM domain-containing protein 3 n=1 Tax=Halyomorpha halys TaxID=286706 RepID=UPI0006D4E374|nr:ankyrin repeat and SAM domain-containing protein 3 [Halyomorpha halys]